MRRSTSLRSLAGAIAAVALAGVASAGAAETGTVRGTIVLERGRLPFALGRAVSVTATDFLGNPVGRIRYRDAGAVLRYDITDLPLGGTLTIELTLREGSFPEAGLLSTGSGVPTLARSDRSSPVYAFVLTHSAPVKAPLDFRVSVTRDPAPQAVSMETVRSRIRGFDVDPILRRPVRR